MTNDGPGPGDIFDAILLAWWSLGAEIIGAIKDVFDTEGIEAEDAIVEFFGITPEEFWTPPLT